MAESDRDDEPPQPTRLERERLTKHSARYIISPKVFEAVGPETVRLKALAEPPRVALIIEINLDQKHADRESGHERVASLVEQVIEGDPGARMAPRDSSRQPSPRAGSSATVAARPISWKVRSSSLCMSSCTTAGRTWGGGTGTTDTSIHSGL